MWVNSLHSSSCLPSLAQAYRAVFMRAAEKMNKNSSGFQDLESVMRRLDVRENELKVSTAVKSAPR